MKHKLTQFFQNT